MPLFPVMVSVMESSDFDADVCLAVHFPDQFSFDRLADSIKLW